MANESSVGMARTKEKIQKAGKSEPFLHNGAISKQKNTCLRESREDERQTIDRIIFGYLTKQ